MTPAALGQQLGLILGEAVIVAALLLALFRLRALWGLAPLYISLGILYQMANLLAATVYIKLGGDLMLSPGSVVLFPAILFAVLFVYIREDAQEARKLIYALLAADLTVALLGLLIAQHFDSPLLFNPHNLSAELFLQEPRILLVGTLALYVDTLLVILVYEWVSRRVTPALFPRIAFALVTVLVFDTALFVTGCFVESPAYGSILLSDMIGKVVAGVVYAGVLTIYLRHFDIVEHPSLEACASMSDLFQVLTYRQRYELLRTQMTRDPLTGIYNRGFFDETLGASVARARRTATPLTLLMIDIDHFKQVNDTYGHRAGDDALRAVAGVIAACSRASDVVCRYGGEEFTVLLPDTELQQGVHLAERIRREVPAALARQGARWSEPPLTVTIGLASYPSEVTTAEELVQVADRRLYAGKASGRNCIVPSGPESAGAALGHPQVVPS